MTGNQTRTAHNIGLFELTLIFFSQQMEFFQRSKIVSIQELTEEIEHSPNIEAYMKAAART